MDCKVTTNPALGQSSPSFLIVKNTLYLQFVKFSSPPPHHFLSLCHKTASKANKMKIQPFMLPEDNIHKKKQRAPFIAPFALRS